MFRIHYYKGIDCQLNLGRIVAFYKQDELSPFQNVTNRRLGRIVALRKLKLNLL